MFQFNDFICYLRSQISLIAIVLVLFAFPTVSFADISKMPMEDELLSMNDENVEINHWEVFVPGDESGYIPVGTVSQGGNSISYPLSDDPIPGTEYLFSMTFEAQQNRADISQILVRMFFFSITNADLLFVKINGEKAILSQPNSNDPNYYAMKFTIEGESLKNTTHQMDFVFNFKDKGGTAGDHLGIKFGNGEVATSLFKDPTIHNPEPATLLIFALGSSVAAIPVCRRYLNLKKK